MGFAANWNTVPVTARFLEISGKPAVGSITFKPVPVRMIDANDLTTVISTDWEVYLDDLGRMKVNLPATDDVDITPIDFTYQVTENFEGGSTYYIEVPMIYADMGVDISLLSQVSSNPGIPSNITREEFDALAMQVEMLLGVVYGGSASTQFAGPGLDGGGVDGT